MTLRQTSPWIPPLALPLGVYLLVLMLLPLAALVLISFWTSDFFQITRVLTAKNYLQVFQKPLYIDLILKSFAIGLMVAIVTVPLSLLAAFVLTFRAPKLSGLLLGFLMASMLSSYLVRIYAWKAILGPSGVINLALINLGLIAEPLSFLLYGNFAIVLTLVYILLPFATLPVYAALQDIDPHVVEAARDLGSGPIGALFRVIIPLAMPGLAAAFLTCFVLAAADYVTPQLVGGADGVMIGRVIADQYGSTGNSPLGGALSVVLLVCFALFVALLWLLRGAWRYVAERHPFHLPATAAKWRLPPLKRLHLPEVGFALILIFLYAPLLVVFLFSFNSASSGIFPMKGLSLQWYAALFRDRMFHVSLINSLLIGAAAIVGCMLIGVPAAFMIVRRQFRLRNGLIALSAGPLVMPGIVIGVSILSALGVLNLKGGLIVTALTHTLFCLPFLLMTLGARLKDYDRQLEEAGRDLGSRPFRVMRTITLPILAPTLVAAAILIFGVSLDEFVITNFVIGANSTLPTMIWGMTRVGVTPTVNALASLTLGASLLLVIFGAIANRRQRKLSILVG